MKAKRHGEYVLVTTYTKKRSADRRAYARLKLVKIVDIKPSLHFPNCVVLIPTCGQDHPSIRPAQMGHKVGDVFTCPYDHKEPKK